MANIIDDEIISIWKKQIEDGEADSCYTMDDIPRLTELFNRLNWDDEALMIYQEDWGIEDIFFGDGGEYGQIEVNLLPFCAIKKAAEGKDIDNIEDLEDIWHYLMSECRRYIHDIEELYYSDIESYVYRLLGEVDEYEIAQPWKKFNFNGFNKEWACHIREMIKLAREKA